MFHDEEKLSWWVLSIIGEFSLFLWPFVQCTEIVHCTHSYTLYIISIEGFPVRSSDNLKKKGVWRIVDWIVV